MQFDDLPRQRIALGLLVEKLPPGVALVLLRRCRLALIDQIPLPKQIKIPRKVRPKTDPGADKATKGPKPTALLKSLWALLESFVLVASSSCKAAHLCLSFRSSSSSSKIPISKPH